jgi:hypothetical protein
LEGVLCGDVGQYVTGLSPDHGQILLRAFN